MSAILAHEVHKHEAGKNAEVGRRRPRQPSGKQVVQAFSGNEVCLECVLCYVMDPTWIQGVCETSHSRELPPSWECRAAVPFHFSQASDAKWNQGILVPSQNRLRLAHLRVTLGGKIHQLYRRQKVCWLFLAHDVLCRSPREEARPDTGNVFARITH